jgi:hypothetical protein
MPKRSTVLPPEPLKKPAAAVKPIEPVPPLRLGQKPRQTAGQIGMSKARQGLRKIQWYKALHS